MNEENQLDLRMWLKRIDLVRQFKNGIYFHFVDGSEFIFKNFIPSIPKKVNNISKEFEYYLWSITDDSDRKEFVEDIFRNIPEYYKFLNRKNISEETK